MERGERERKRCGLTKVGECAGLDNKHRLGFRLVREREAAAAWSQVRAGKRCALRRLCDWRDDGRSLV